MDGGAVTPIGLETPIRKFRCGPWDGLRYLAIWIQKFPAPGSSLARCGYLCSRDLRNGILIDVTPSILETYTPSADNSGPAPADRRVLLLKPRGFCAGVVRAI